METAINSNLSRSQAPAETGLAVLSAIMAMIYRVIKYADSFEALLAHVGTYGIPNSVGTAVRRQPLKKYK